MPDVRPATAIRTPVYIAVAPDVHPVASPTLAVLGAGQKAIDDFLVSVPGIVGQKGLQLFPRRRKADQIEIYASQQYALVRRGHGMQLALFLLGSNKRVDRIAHEGCVFH